MGSICRMNDTTRAAAIYRQDPDFLSPVRRYVGATIVGVDLSINDPIGTISALLTVRMADGTTEELDGPVLAEEMESGVLGFDLQDRYERDELRRLLEAAIADPDNGLDEHDRRAIRGELEGLDEHYGR